MKHFGILHIKNSSKIYLMSKPKVLAIIPARGGSKGLKDKNIASLLSKPLIAWSIEAALHSSTITNTLVSSDSDTILDIAKQYGASILKRPDALAKDTTPSEPVISHVLENVSESYDYLILLQPTSPLRNSKDIDAAFNLLMRKEADALISVYEPSHHPLKSFTTTAEGYLEGIVNNDYPFMRRQDLPQAMYPNGAIYIISVALFKQTQKLFAEKTLAYLMPQSRSIDVDSQEDLALIEAYLLKEARA